MQEPFFVYYFNEVDNGSIKSSLEGFALSLLLQMAVNAFAINLMVISYTMFHG